MKKIIQSKTIPAIPATAQSTTDMSQKIPEYQMLERNENLTIGERLLICEKRHAENGFVIPYLLIDLNANLALISAAANHSEVFPGILLADFMPPKVRQD